MGAAKKAGGSVSKAAKKAGGKVSKAAKKAAGSTAKAVKKPTLSLKDAMREAKKAGKDISATAKKAGGDIARTDKKATKDIIAAGKKLGGDIAKADKKATKDVVAAAKKVGGDIARADKQASKDLGLGGIADKVKGAIGLGGSIDVQRPTGSAPSEAAKQELTKLKAQEIARKDIGDITAQEAAEMKAERIARGDIREVGTQLQLDPQAQVRAQQMNLAQQLQAQAAGTAPSIAEMQAKRQGERALAATLAQQAGQTGPGAALSRREAARGLQATQADIAAESGLLRLQEQQAAQQQLGQLTGQVRGQDISVATTQAESDLKAQLANQGMDLATVKANAAAGNAAALANLKSVTDAAERDLKAKMANQGVDLAVLKANAAAGDAAALNNLNAELAKMGLDNDMVRAYLSNELGFSKLETDAQIAEGAAKTKLLGGALGAGATLGAAFISDINLKKDIKDGKNSIGEFLGSLKPYDYKYKDEKHGEGDQTSIMAQDLEESEIGKKSIIETPDGKMVDYAKLLPAMLAANADTHHRIMKLEDALKAKKGKK
jgi:hypothetical protein